MIESVCIGRFDAEEQDSPSMALAGQPLPPLSRDYGFEYASKLSSTDLSIGSKPLGHHYRSSQYHRHRSTPASYQVSDNNEPNSDSHDPDDDFELRGPSQALANVAGGRAKAKKSTLGSPRLCISCGATKTPYWREAWSNSVLLCNACGLRYSKFKRRCLDCSYVPRKEDKGSRVCTKCNGPWS